MHRAVSGLASHPGLPAAGWPAAVDAFLILLAFCVAHVAAHRESVTPTAGLHGTLLTLGSSWSMILVALLTTQHQVA